MADREYGQQIILPALALIIGILILRDTEQTPGG